MNPTIRDSFRKLAALVIAGLLLGAPASVHAQPAAPAYLFTHLAGPLGGPGSADGPGPDARFNMPYYLTVDRTGNVYVADKDNHSIRRITPGGTVTTLTAPDGSVLLFSTPTGVAVDSAGNVVVADSARDTIYRISPAGVLSTLAGASYMHHTYYSGHLEITVGDNVDATGTAARFCGPLGLAADNAGNVYVADSGNHTIRKISPAGEVTTLAGTGGQTGSTDDTGAAARFNRPGSVAVDAIGNVYVADTNNHVLRKISPAGEVTTLVGTAGQTGSTDGTGAVARFYLPTGVTVDAVGNVYVTDAANDTVRQITPAGAVTTLAGQPGQSGSADGIGAAARFENPSTLAADGSGNLYVADPNNYTIRKIAPGAVVSTFAGLVGGFGAADGTGPAARFYFPQGLALDRSGNIIVADFYNHAIRKVTPSGTVTTLATAAGGPTGSSLLYYPSGVAVDGAGNTYVANAGGNSILKVTPDGVVSTFAGPANPHALIFGHTDGAAADARFAYPEGIAIDRAGNLYVADSGNNIIRKITPGGTVSTLAGTAGPPGSADGTGAEARFNSPLALAADDAGNVFVADSHNHTIRKITPAGVVTTFAGTVGSAGAPGSIGSADGVGSAARFSGPWGVAVDNAGNVFVGDSTNSTIRKITPDGTVTTIGGKVAFIGSADGLGPAANFYVATALAVDGAGTLYIADEYNHAIRKGQPAGPPVITSQPQSQTVAPGANVQLSVTASSVLAATYQWYVNGSSFNGATSSTLGFTNARTSDAGDYTAVVTNQLGSVISAKATLTVSAAPVTPPTPPATSSGGGTIEPGLGLALLALGAARALATRRETRNRA